MQAMTLFLLGTLVGILLALALYVVLVRPFDQRRADSRYRNRTDQLVALTSHYLLTPISIIQNALARLQEDDNTMGPADRHHYYDTIFQGQQRLWILAERFVIVDEIETGQGLKLAMKVGDLSKLVGDSVAAVDAFAREKKLKIRYEEQVNVTTWETHLDQRRLKQALIAVLDNAVKFSQEGGEVLVSLEYESGTYRLTVTDAGIGMPKELASRLGEPLSRGTSMYNFDYEGIGLGLYIAKEVIRSLGGGISIDSQLKKGTTVRVEFPNQ